MPPGWGSSDASLPKPSTQPPKLILPLPLVTGVLKHVLSILVKVIAF